MPGFPTLNEFETPEAWNAAWEKIMQPTLSSPRLPRVCFEQELGLVHQRPNVEGFISMQLLQSQVDREELCELQQLITRESTLYFAHRDLEAKWMAADSALRQKHVLISLAKASSLRWYLNDPRCYCPHELRLEYLGGRDGKVFLDLVKSVLLDDYSVVPKTPLYISHPLWDKFVADQDASKLTKVEKAVFDRILLLRTKLICHVLQFTMHSFLGLNPSNHIVSKLDKTTMAAAWVQVEKLVKPALQQSLGHQGAKTFLKIGKKTFPGMLFPRHKHHCSYPDCQRVEPSDDSVRFSLCQACSEKAQREFRYCSVECQRKDWKPRHKVMCGKPLDIETVSKAIADSLEPTDAAVHATEYIGSPADGFKRSEFLAGQVVWLNEHLKVDYRLMDEKGFEGDLTIQSEAHPMTKHIFRIYREMAMTQGKILPVSILTHFLCWFARLCKHDAIGLTPSAIVSQLAREFDLDVAFLRQEVLGVQSRQMDGPQHKPLLLKGMQDVVWMKEYGDVNPEDTLITFN
ncbi:hypothetical protein C8R43DRAFT_977139 [Mycena crocata]|nr:hypothetical protein C8R43DRAFT_977139 [Mycena crocata]